MKSPECFVNPDLDRGCIDGRSVDEWGGDSALMPVDTAKTSIASLSGNQKFVRFIDDAVFIVTISKDLSSRRRDSVNLETFIDQRFGLMSQNKRTQRITHRYN